MYLSWAIFSEGPSDRAYLNILLPRMMQDILLSDGLRPITVPADPAIPLGTNGRGVQEVAEEICAARNAFHILFIHADTGGRALSRGIDNRSTAYCARAAELCQWDVNRCVLITPRHEIEAWALADAQAVATAFGYSGSIAKLSLPANAGAAEAITDPKATLDAAYRFVAGRRAARGASQTLPAIARHQRLQVLRGCESFQGFEQSLRSGLRSLGCIAQ